MRSITSVLRRFAREEEGASMVEYGLLVALIAVACIATIGLLGGQLNSLFAAVKDKIVVPQ